MTQGKSCFGTGNRSKATHDGMKANPASQRKVQNAAPKDLSLHAPHCHHANCTACSDPDYKPKAPTFTGNRKVTSRTSQSSAVATGAVRSVAPRERSRKKPKAPTFTGNRKVTSRTSQSSAVATGAVRSVAPRERSRKKLKVATLISTPASEPAPDPIPVVVVSTPAAEPAPDPIPVVVVSTPASEPAPDPIPVVALPVAAEPTKRRVGFVTDASEVDAPQVETSSPPCHYDPVTPAVATRAILRADTNDLAPSMDTATCTVIERTCEVQSPPSHSSDTQNDQVLRARNLTTVSYRGAHIVGSSLEKLQQSGLVQVALVVEGTCTTRAALQEIIAGLPVAVADLEQGCAAAYHFALVVYSSTDAAIVEPSFITADAVASQLSDVKSVEPIRTPGGCFGALTAATNELPWSASQRAVIWIGSHPPQGTLQGLEDVAHVMAQNVIACSFVEAERNTSDFSTDEMNRVFSQAGAVLESYNEPHISFSVQKALKAILLSTVRSALVKQFPVPFDNGHDNFSVTLSTVCVEMDVPPGVHPLSNLMTRFPPSHEERVRVQLEAHPFADGELCNAYRVTVDHPTFFATWRETGEKVAKMARYAIPGWAQQRVHIRCVTTFLMREFSARLSQRDKQGTHRRMESVPAQLAEYSGHAFVVEPYVAGEFLKFNNNNGTTFGAPEHPVPQAFSHFTHHYTGGRLIVVNLQGVTGEKCYTCTGAVIHTASRDKILPDSTNLGPAGMAAFYSTHQCNDVCRLLDLPDVPRDDDALEEFVEKLALEKKSINKWLADHSDIEYTMGM